jgi:hypothetical protein
MTDTDINQNICSQDRAPKKLKQGHASDQRLQTVDKQPPKSGRNRMAAGAIASNRRVRARPTTKSTQNVEGIQERPRNVYTSRAGRRRRVGGGARRRGRGREEEQQRRAAFGRGV